eukprot:TRINITY_DN3011_c0_g1_i1.p1 TRINITY_DN3011_c0_g1~~TRINITY_DN3011_c0_g1_i1.p1  ORF type:complete len:390 (+),score=50.11 TRINITY_DN3011_c0_g1_i1:96-1265(+)
MEEAAFLPSHLWRTEAISEEEAVALFSTTYDNARTRIIEKAKSKNLKVTSFPIGGVGPNGKELFIDAIWIGQQEAENVEVVCSATHGTEGFLGSAVQLALVESVGTKDKALSFLANPPEDKALLLIHSVNPWGMAWKSRWNQDGVDLNRNYLPQEKFVELKQKKNALYDDLYPTLHPDNPSATEGLSKYIDTTKFYLKSAYNILRIGMQNMKRAIAGGQYVYEDGLFFGGSSLSINHTIISESVIPMLQGKSQVTVVDIHTGLGPWGCASLLEVNETLGRKFSRPVDVVSADDSVTYPVQGALVQGFERDLQGSKVDTVVVEVGAYSSIDTLRSLIEERAYSKQLKQHEISRDINHPILNTVFETFCPESATWKHMALRECLAAIHEAR